MAQCADWSADVCLLWFDGGLGHYGNVGLSLSIRYAGFFHHVAGRVSPAKNVLQQPLLPAGVGQLPHVLFACAQKPVVGCQIQSRAAPKPYVQLAPLGSCCTDEHSVCIW